VSGIFQSGSSVLGIPAGCKPQARTGNPDDPNGKAHRDAQQRYNGLPQQNRAGYDKGSPLTYVDRMKGKLLVVHGSGDDNVHDQNTEALVNALVKANKQFDMMEYPNRNHSISGGTTRMHLFELLTRFLRNNLAGPGLGAPVL